MRISYHHYYAQRFFYLTPFNFNVFDSGGDNPNNITSAPVVQWIEHWSPEPKIWVRLPAGVPAS